MSPLFIFYVYLVCFIKMNINIFGSTGIIGSKSLAIVKKYYPDIKVNLLVANTSHLKLISQTIRYKPKFISIKNEDNIQLIRKKINNLGTKIIKYDQINVYLKSTKSHYTILSISGYHALYFLENIALNTRFLGLVNKECVVSAGHLFKKFYKKNSNFKIYPLDSEHFSLNINLKNLAINDYKNIFITASGGPFFSNKNINLKTIKFKDAIKHPKWKMGYKNSIDSATLANKCLELIEAHYLFSIPFSKLKILIHPESLVHSIVEYSDLTSNLNSFYPDMFIPIFNFFDKNHITKSEIIKVKKFNFSNVKSLNFFEVDDNQFPVYKIFKKLNKHSPADLIKFNCANQFAVDLFKDSKIEYDQIPFFINKAMKIKSIYPVNNIKNIIKFQNVFNKKLILQYED